MKRAQHRALKRDASWPPLVTIVVDDPRELPPIVLCPDCGGDWCPSCRFTGMAVPR